jgi:hypothetical protein
MGYLIYKNTSKKLNFKFAQANTIYAPEFIHKILKNFAFIKEI